MYSISLSSFLCLAFSVSDFCQSKGISFDEAKSIQLNIFSVSSDGVSFDLEYIS